MKMKSTEGLNQHEYHRVTTARARARTHTVRRRTRRRRRLETVLRTEPNRTEPNRVVAL